MRNTVATLIILALAAPAVGAPLLQLPVDCTLGDTCYIQQFMDHDPSDAFSDFKCGPRSYNTHKGTDFAVPTARDAQRGVDVIASAPGTVLGVRDGMADVWDGKIDVAKIAGRECGNGLVIDHGDGWQTQYCHMKFGSLTVQKGETVQAGTLLGQIGMSGRTEFAHLHLSLRKDGEPVDPFAPDGAVCDAPITQTLWATPPLVQPGGILDIGFSDKVPSFGDVRMGTAEERLTRISPALVSFFYMFGGRAGDLIEMSFQGPGDFSVESTYELTKDRAQFMRAVGKKRRSAPWPGGTYTASARHMRDGAIISEGSAQFEIPR